jgi:cell division protein FtsN
VRVGPFASQGEADKVASRIKSLALSASVLKM